MPTSIRADGCGGQRDHRLAAVTQGPATAYARSVTSWSDLDWWRLESRAFSGQPRVKQSLAFFAPTSAWKDLSSEVPSALGCLLVPAHIASLSFPIFATIAMIAWLIGQAPIGVFGTAGALAGFAAAWMLLSMYLDARTPDGRTVNGARQISLLHVAPSSVSVAISVIALTQDPAIAALGALGAAADLVVGLIALRFYRPTSGDPQGTMRLNERRLERSLASVSDADRLAILEDISTAIAALETGGLIDAGVGRAARQTPFGHLAMEFAPREETRPANRPANRRAPGS